MIKFVGMSIKESIKYITDNLAPIYDETEAINIAYWIIEYITGLNKSQLISSRLQLDQKQIEQVNSITVRLLSHEPIQYILHQSFFYGFSFYVDKNVLIPRPETEELVDWIISDCKFPINQLSILDVGTGSGCIAASLKRKLRKADVWAIDISPAALDVAKKNATNLSADIKFLEIDFLNTSDREALTQFHIIVSNPPYIPIKDKASMKAHVVEYEPATALFVPDNDALLFYKSLAEFGRSHLQKNGSIYMEIHENLGPQVRKLFEMNNYHTQLKKDMQGKDRMIKASI
jgi:release factor glutamine methyltransferase